MQHYSRNTVAVSEWCKKCGQHTMHRVDGVKLGPCLDCMEKNLEKLKMKAAEPPAPSPPKQLDLFGK